MENEFKIWLIIIIKKYKKSLKNLKNTHTKKKFRKILHIIEF